MNDQWKEFYAGRNCLERGNVDWSIHHDSRREKNMSDRRVLKSASRNKKRTSAAKAALQMRRCGTAEAVPLSKTGFNSSL
jgi:hypothetical protein